MLKTRLKCWEIGVDNGGKLGGKVEFIGFHGVNS